MTTTRRNALAAGVCFLVAAATSIVALALYQPVLGHRIGEHGEAQRRHHSGPELVGDASAPHALLGHGRSLASVRNGRHARAQP